MKESEVETGKVFDGTKKVTIYSTNKDAHHPTGSPIEVGILAAKDLVKNGFACETEDEALIWEGPAAPTATELKARKENGAPAPKTKK